MADVIEIRGLKELQQRFAQFPQKFHNSVKTTMQAALLAVWSSVPPYPAPPPDSTYVRTGTLGRTLGSGFEGGKAGGQPDIYEVVPMGGAWEGHFGTNLDYAPYVIGDETQAAHMGHWWKMKDVAERAKAKVISLFDTMTDTLARWLDGQGL